MRSLAQEALSIVASPVVTPPWLLYFMRIAKAVHGDYAEAWVRLPDHLPRNVRCPTMPECVAALAAHGLA